MFEFLNFKYEKYIEKTKKIITESFNIKLSSKN